MIMVMIMCQGRDEREAGSDSGEKDGSQHGKGQDNHRSIDGEKAAGVARDGRPISGTEDRTISGINR
jgi:hypothetical protein